MLFDILCYLGADIKPNFSKIARKQFISGRQVTLILCAILDMGNNLIV
ncbi:MAG: hypothetical protein QOG13_2335 [Sphingomonadales bacterium]|nr:hypothetical protein [Sphingomonadales bacterium]